MEKKMEMVNGMSYNRYLAVELLSNSLYADNLDGDDWYNAEDELSDFLDSLFPQGSYEDDEE